MAYEHDYESLLSKFEALQYDFRRLEESYHAGKPTKTLAEEQFGVTQRMMWLLEKMVWLLNPDHHGGNK